MKGNLCKSVLLKDTALPQSLPGGARGVVKFGDGGSPLRAGGGRFWPQTCSSGKEEGKKVGLRGGGGFTRSKEAIGNLMKNRRTPKSQSRIIVKTNKIEH